METPYYGRPIPEYPYSAIVYKDGNKVIARDMDGKLIAKEDAGVDDAYVIQSALDVGGHICISKGTYYINEPLLYKPTITKLEGSWLGTKLVANAEMDYMIDGRETSVGKIYSANISNLLLDLNGKARGGISFERTNAAVRHNISYIRMLNPNTTGTLEGINLTGCEGSCIFRSIIDFGNYGTGVKWYVPNGHVEILSSFVKGNVATDIQAQTLKFNSAVIYGSQACIFFDAIYHSANIDSCYIVNDGSGKAITSNQNNPIRNLKIVSGLISGKNSQTLIELLNTDGRVSVEDTKFVSDDGSTLTAFNIPNIYTTPKRCTYKNVNKGTYEPPTAFEMVIVLIKGAGSDITGNSSTAYATLIGSVIHWNPLPTEKIKYVEWNVRWDPGSASGGIKLIDGKNGVTVDEIIPGAAGFITSTRYITSYIKGLTDWTWFALQTKGDGTSAPTIEESYLRIAISEEEPY